MNIKVALQNTLLTICFFLNIPSAFATTSLTTCVDLQNIKLSGQYVLANDINCGGMTFTPIGTNNAPFTGTLDGAGYKISYLTITAPGTDYVGLFGATNNAKISHLTLENVNITGQNDVGALVGMAQDTQITQVSSSGTLKGEYQGNLEGNYMGGLVGALLNNSKLSDDSSSANVSIIDSYAYFNVGGLVGYAKNSTIYASHATGNVNATFNVGGLIGRLEDSSASYSYATGTVNVTGTSNPSGNQNIGGLIGEIVNNTTNSSVSNSYATGSVNNQLNPKVYALGGLVGAIFNSYNDPMCSSGITTRISDSFATGAVSGNYAVGGLVGQLYEVTISVTNSYSVGQVSGNSSGGLIGYDTTCTPFVTHSYWDTQTSNQTVSKGGEGKTTQQMYQQSTYVGWDFNSIWNINEGHSYPNLILSPLHVKNCTNLQNIDHYSNAQYVLDNDIDCSGVNFFSIGNFTGIFNGAGHKISHLQTDYGLFSTTKNATIEQVTLEDINFNSAWNGSGIGTGAIVGTADATNISNVSASGTIRAVSSSSQSVPFGVGGLVGELYDKSTLSSGISSVNINPQVPTGYYASGDTGGLVGIVGDSSVEKSYATGLITGGNWVGGLVGSFASGSITDSYATGVTTGVNNVGGFVGTMGSSYNPLGPVSIARCFAIGNVKSSGNFAGGLIGVAYNYDPQQISITDSFANGNVVGGNDVGGLIGKIDIQAASIILENNYSTGSVTATALSGQRSGLIGLYSGQANGNVNSCYWDMQTSGQISPSCGPNTNVAQCGIGKNTNQMYQQQTFVNWNFNTVWDIKEDSSYPCLRGLSCTVLKIK